jgi:hypothetical protein
MEQQKIREILDWHIRVDEPDDVQAVHRDEMIRRLSTLFSEETAELRKEILQEKLNGATWEKRSIQLLRKVLLGETLGHYTEERRLAEKAKADEFLKVIESKITELSKPS